MSLAFLVGDPNSWGCGIGLAIVGGDGARSPSDWGFRDGDEEDNLATVEYVRRFLGVGPSAI